MTPGCSPACLCLHRFREFSHAAIPRFLLFYALDSPVRDDEPEFYPRRHQYRFLSDLGGAVRPPLPASPLRMGRAAVQAGDDDYPPSSQTGMGASCPLAAHHRPDAGACPSVLAECEHVNPPGTGKKSNRYHLLAPSDRLPCPPGAGLYRGKWTHRPQTDLPHPLHTGKESTDASGNPFPAVALAHGLPQGLARAGPPAKIFKHRKIISPVNGLRVVSHWIHGCIRSERSIFSVIHPRTCGVTYPQWIQKLNT